MLTPFRWRRNEWCYNVTSAAIVSAVVIVTVSVNAFAHFVCCERTNVDGGEVRV